MILQTMLLLLVVLALAVPVMGQASQLTPLGADQTTLSGCDDCNLAVSLTSVFPYGINFGGTVYSQLYISSNGYITFGHGNSSYSPLGIQSYTQGPIVAAQYDDLLPRSHGNIYYNQNTSGNYVVVSFVEVAPYRTPTGVGSGYNSFQIVLRKPAGYGAANQDFQIELRYQALNWAKSGNNSAWPTAGWSAGDQATYAVLPYSGTSSFLSIQYSSNIGVNGVYQWDVEGGVVQSVPTVNQTDSPSLITGSSAVSGGNVSSDGGLPVTTRGLAYGTSSGPTTSNWTVTSGSGTGSFTATMSGLSPGNLYYVRAFATNSLGTGYGPERSFSTPSQSVPSVTTSSVSAISENSAVSGGNVTGDGGAAVSARGIAYGTGPNPTTSGPTVSAGSGTGSFSATMPGLSSGTTYYVRAYAVNAVGTAYGNQVSFTTSCVITSSAGANGSISPSGTVVRSQGQSQTYTMTPDTGYHVSNVLVDGSSVGAVGSYTFSNISANHTISAAFAIDTFTITANAGANGSISPSGQTTRNYGQSQAYAITPDTGYHVSDVLVDGSSAGAVGSYTFSSISADHTISAAFAIDTFTITANAGANGSISPSGETTRNYGQSQAYTITPDTGYHVSDVLVDGSSAGAVGSYTFSSISADHTISAAFAIDTFTITANAGANGSISPSGETTRNYGQSQAYTITPDTGYYISDVRVDGDSVGAVGSYTFSSISADHTIMVSFCPELGEIARTAPGQGERYSYHNPPAVLDWNDVAAAVSYDVYFGKGDPDPDTMAASGLSVSYWEVPETLEPGTWYWKVIAWNSCGLSAVGATWNFEIYCPELGEVSVTAPFTGQAFTMIEPPLQLDWENVSNALSYDLWMGYASEAAMVRVASGLEASSWNISWNPAALAPGTWYWKVEASNNCSTAASGTATFEIIDCPELGELGGPSPASGSDHSYLDPPTKLDWSEVAGAETYDLYLEKENGNPSLLAASGLESAGWNLAERLDPGEYYWKVRARNVCGEVSEGQVWSFSVECPEIGAINAAVPVSGAKFNILEPPIQLDWNTVENATVYDLYLEMDNPDADRLVASRLSESSWKLPRLVPGTWYWKVRAGNGCDEEVSPVWSFTVLDCPAPGAVIQRYPGEGERFNLLELPDHLEWNEVENGVSYSLYLSRENSDPGLVAKGLTANSRDLPADLETGTWYWRVEVFNQCEESESGPTWSFTVGCPPLGEISPVYPPIGETYSSLNLPGRIEWAEVENADTYDVFLENGDPNPDRQVAAGTSVTSLSLGDLDPGTWYWRIEASSECGESESGPVWSFVIDDCSEIDGVALVSPAVDSAWNTSDPLKSLEWELLPNATYYHVWLEKDDMSPDVMVAEGLSGNTLELEGLEAGTWYWRVEAGNDCNRQGSETGRFTVTDDGPELGEFSLLYPSDGAVFDPASPPAVLDWTDGDGAVSYAVYLEKGNPQPEQPAGNPEESRLDLEGLEPGTWYWKVEAGNGEGASRESETWSFTVNEPAEAETVLYYPQFISGDRNGTEFILVNNCGEEKQGSIIYYSNESSGHSGKIVRVENWAIPSRDVLVQAWKGKPGESVKVGGVEITQEGDTSCRIEGTEFISAGGAYITVSDAELRSAQQIFARRKGTLDTCFALYNPGGEELKIEASYFAGGAETRAEVILGPKGHRAMFLGELMPGLPAETSGTLNFFAEGEREFVLMGLVAADLETSAMITLPAGPNAFRGDSPVAGSETRAAGEENPELGAVLYFPQFISGDDSGTGFFLVNNCDEAKRGSIVYFSSGNTGEAGSIVGEREWAIPGRTVLVQDNLELPGGGLEVGAIEVRQAGDTSCRIEGIEFFNALGSYTTVNRAEPREGQQVFALRSSGRNTGFAVYNPNDYGITLEIIFHGGGGSAGTELVLGPRGHRAMFLDELLPGIPSGVAGTLNFFSSAGDDFTLMGLLLVDPESNAVVALPVSGNAY